MFAGGFDMESIQLMEPLVEVYHVTQHTSCVHALISHASPNAPTKYFLESFTFWGDSLIQYPHKTKVGGGGTI